MGDKSESSVKKFARLLSNTSHSFLASLLHDSADKKEARKATADILQKLRKAAVQNSLVVLQVQDVDNPAKYETVSGWIATKKISDDKVLIQVQGDNQPLRMIPTYTIKKVTALTLKGSSQGASR